MKSLETCIEDCQQRGAKIGLWSAQLEAIKAAFKLPVTGEVAWFWALLYISAVQRCQMIHPLLPMMKGNLEQVNTICGDSECVKVHSPKHEVQTSVGFAIVMAWGQYKIPCFVERQDTTLLLIIKIGYHWYQSVSRIGHFSNDFIWWSIFFLFGCKTRPIAIDINTAWLPIHLTQPKIPF